VFCAPVRNVVEGYEKDAEKIKAFHAKLTSAIFNGEVRDTLDPSVSFSNYTSDGGLKEAVYLSSELPKGEKERILRAFKVPDEPPFVVCTVGMLVEGFDFPKLQSLMLLRPTLSMRLFEQQVGRVVRTAPGKERGRIFEVAYDTSSIYDRFGDEVFSGKNMEKAQMLRPESRVEELFTEGGDTRAVEEGKIVVSELSLSSTVDGFEERSVQIPPTSLRARELYRLLSKANEKTMGKFVRETDVLSRHAIGFKVCTIEDAMEISRIATQLEQLEREAMDDPRLSESCRRGGYKHRMFREVRYLLKLRALTYLKYFSNLSLDEKRWALSILGFDGDYDRVDEYRLRCLEKGGYGDVDQLVRRLEGIKSISSLLKLKKQEVSRLIIPTIYWAYCFLEDEPRLRELFESKKWNYNVKRYLVRRA